MTRAQKCLILLCVPRPSRASRSLVTRFDRFSEHHSGGNAASHRNRRQFHGGDGSDLRYFQRKWRYFHASLTFLSSEFHAVGFQMNLPSLST